MGACRSPKSRQRLVGRFRSDSEYLVRRDDWPTKREVSYDGLLIDQLIDPSYACLHPSPPHGGTISKAQWETRQWHAMHPLAPKRKLNATGSNVARNPLCPVLSHGVFLRAHRWRSRRRSPRNRGSQHKTVGGPSFEVDGSSDELSDVKSRWLPGMNFGGRAAIGL